MFVESNSNWITKYLAIQFETSQQKSREKISLFTKCSSLFVKHSALCVLMLHNGRKIAVRFYVWKVTSRFRNSISEPFVKQLLYNI